MCCVSTAGRFGIRQHEDVALDIKAAKPGEQTCDTRARAHTCTAKAPDTHSV